jgi:ribonucleoside-diphosphate reductase beta chain
MEAAVAHEQIHWGEWEAKLQPDVNNWKTGIILPHEKNHIKQILRLFTQTDVQVGANYCDLWIPKFKNNEIRNMLLSFAAREGTHQRAYALLNDTLGFPESEYQIFLEIKPLADKIAFMQNNDTSTQSGLGLSLAQTVCNEGMALFSAFAMLLSYQRFGKMRGMSEIVEWSIKDENKHVLGMSKLFREYCKEHPRIVNDEFKKNIYEMYKSAVQLEDKVIELAFEMGPIQGLTEGEMKEYIRYIADRRLLQLGMKTIFDARENPLPWLDWIISGDSFKNFFEGQVTDYNSAGMSGDWEWEAILAR